MRVRTLQQHLNAYPLSDGSRKALKEAGDEYDHPNPESILGRLVEEVIADAVSDNRPNVRVSGVRAGSGPIASRHREKRSAARGKAADGADGGSGGGDGSGGKRKA